VVKNNDVKDEEHALRSLSWKERPHQQTTAQNNTLSWPILAGGKAEKELSAVRCMPVINTQRNTPSWPLAAMGVACRLDSMHRVAIQIQFMPRRAASS